MTELKLERTTGMIPPRATKTKDQYYLELAQQVSTQSKDPSTQCGAVIVDSFGYPLGYGYNGTPRRIDDNAISWERPGKYKFIIHSEENAINHSDRSKLRGSTIYVNNRPCPGCMLRIVNAGITRVVFFDRQINDSGSSLNKQNWLDSLEIIRLVKDITVESYSYDDTTGLYIRTGIWGKC